MQPIRDTQIRLGTRQANLIRLERLRRAIFFCQALTRLCFRALQREASLRPRQQAALALHLTRYARDTSAVRHKTRCVQTGRARQVSRSTLLARMEFRRVLREGRLPGYILQRS